MNRPRHRVIQPVTTLEIADTEAHELTYFGTAYEEKNS